MQTRSEERPTKRRRIERTVELNDDSLFVIFSFLTCPELLEVSLVCSTWFHLSSHNAIWQQVHDNCEHLSELAKLILEVVNDEVDYQDNTHDHFTEFLTWKPSLLERLGFEASDDPKHPGIPLTEDVEDFDLEAAVHSFGVPLQLNTIEDQFELVAGLIRQDHYAECIRERLRTEVGLVPTDEYRLKQLCLEERRLMVQYMNKTHKAVQYEDKYTSGAPLEGDIWTAEFIQYIGFISGLHRLSRSAGVKYYQPDVVEVMKEQLQDFVRSLVHHTIDIVERNCEETESVDSTSGELEITEEHVHQSLQTVANCILYRGPVTEEAYRAMDDIEPIDADYWDVAIGEDLDDEEDVNSEEENIEDFIEQQNFDNDQPTSAELADEEFIDDSSDSVLSRLDLNNLGDSLEEMLLQVSIRVHETVYGKERAHEEKRYLTNWLFGSNSSIFQHASVNEDYVDKDTLDYEQMTEQERIEAVVAEDESYFASPCTMFTEENEDEESEEVDGTEYHLRRLLRQESFKCIDEYFNKLENYELLKIKPL